MKINAAMIALCLLFPPTLSLAAEGPYEIAASGCGSRGGPGWRIKSTGKCASHKNLRKACGNPPSSKKCTKEA
ncbi:hypothetical protein [Shinella granuli]|uniref:Uncharacterized protein n=1 Tax=Shinella granuli TaxID=323621 RepID=A0A4R2CSE3_SHIGR|nr:hypothetical protein [Shinella granuli]TCN42424.1 hypothetical protein EV665_112159 [Shinella granuli]